MIINMLKNLVYLACMIVFFVFGVAIAPVLRSDINTTQQHDPTTQHEPDKHMYQIYKHDRPLNMQFDHVETAIAYLKSLESNINRHTTHSPYTIRNLTPAVWPPQAATGKDPRPNRYK